MISDLNRLRSNIKKLVERVEYLDFKLADAPGCEDPSDISYLNENDLANPEIVANVSAMEETNKLISWIGSDFEGFIGFWHGPEDLPENKSPIVRLDTEGQYAIVTRTIPDYILVSCDGDEFSSIRDFLITIGFNTSASIDEIWNSVEGIYRNANNFRNELYNQDRARRGLKSLD